MARSESMLILGALLIILLTDMTDVQLTNLLIHSSQLSLFITELYIISQITQLKFIRNKI